MHPPPLLLHPRRGFCFASAASSPRVLIRISRLSSCIVAVPVLGCSSSGSSPPQRFDLGSDCLLPSAVRRGICGLVSPCSVGSLQQPSPARPSPAIWGFLCLPPPPNLLLCIASALPGSLHSGRLPLLSLLPPSDLGFPSRFLHGLRPPSARFRSVFAPSGVSAFRLRFRRQPSDCDSAGRLQPSAVLPLATFRLPTARFGFLVFGLDHSICLNRTPSVWDFLFGILPTHLLFGFFVLVLRTPAFFLSIYMDLD